MIPTRERYAVQPASMAQVAVGQGGRTQVLDDDVGNVVKDLQRIDRSFRVRYLFDGDCFVISQEIVEGERRSEHFCFSVHRASFDQRVVKEAERISHARYDLAGELEAGGERRERDRRDRLQRKIEDGAEQAVFAMRREIGAKDRVFVP